MEWKTVKFEDTSILFIDGDRGKNYPNGNDFLEKGHCIFLNAGNVTKNGWNFKNLSYISEEKDNLLRNGKLQYRDVVLTTRGTVGNVVIYTEDVPYQHIRINSGMVIIRDNGACDAIYLYQFLRSKLFLDQVVQYQSGSAQPQLPISALKKLTFSLPDLDTQRRIAAILSSLDDKIENNNRINRNLEAQAQALFKSWFVDFEPWGGTMPDDWRKQKLGQIIELYRGVSYSSKDIKEGDYALLSMNNIRPWGGFLYDFSRKFSGRFKEIHKLNPYDLIMCITDITQERRLIGYTALIPPYYDNLIMCTHLLKVTSEKYDSRFLNGLFNYSGLSRFIADCATGTTVLGLTADIVKGIEWTIPTPEVAKKYSNMVIDMYDSIFRNNQESHRLAALRDTLLPKLMRGEITL